MSSDAPYLSFGFVADSLVFLVEEIRNGGYVPTFLIGYIWSMHEITYVLQNLEILLVLV